MWPSKKHSFPVSIFRLSRSFYSILLRAGLPRSAQLWAALYFFFSFSIFQEFFWCVTRSGSFYIPVMPSLTMHIFGWTIVKIFIFFNTVLSDWLQTYWAASYHLDLDEVTHTRSGWWLHQRFPQQEFIIQLKVLPRSISWPLIRWDLTISGSLTGIMSFTTFPSSLISSTPL